MRPNQGDSRGNRLTTLTNIPFSNAPGPAVIRMFAGFIGQGKFQKGLTFYLDNKFGKQHTLISHHETHILLINRKYQNAVNEDLWKAMSNQSTESLELPADIATIMNSWSLQTGYPIVTVRRNYDLQSAIVTQVKLRTKFPNVKIELNF